MNKNNDNTTKIIKTLAPNSVLNLELLRRIIKRNIAGINTRFPGLTKIDKIEKTILQTKEYFRFINPKSSPFI